MGGSVFGPHKQERIAFLGKFGGAKLGHIKIGLGRSKIVRFNEKCANLGEAEVCLIAQAGSDRFSVGDMETAANRLQEAAKREDIEASALRYFELTLNCIDCHQYLETLGH